MWEKVNLTDDGKLIRESDGQQVGELSVPVLYRAELSIYEVNGHAINVHHGYVDEAGLLHELCTAISCSLECLNKQNSDCRYCLKGGEKQGMYIDI